MLTRSTILFAARTILASFGSTALILLVGCEGGDSFDVSSSMHTPVTETRRTTATPTPELPTRTPFALALTPQPISYRIDDPAFEPLPGAEALYGIHERAAYKIEIPMRWNGSLVLFAHGYRGHDPVLIVDPPPLREHFIENGYAWAASSYTANGYAVGVGAEDTRRLVQLFDDLVAEPERIYLYGSSLGGHVTTYLMETYPAEFDGALAECGAVAGARVLDYFLSWTVIAAHLTDVPEALTGDPARFLAAITEIDARLGPIGSPTIEGRRFESIMSQLTGGPRPWRHEGFAQGRLWNSLIVLEAITSPDASLAAASNEFEMYQIDDGLGLTDGELNANVPRVAAAWDADAADEHFLEPVSGRIERPYLMISNTGDFAVPISQLQIYRRAVEDAGRVAFLVQRAVRAPGHCNFSVNERRRAFDDLVTWVEDGVRPFGDDLTADLTRVGFEFTDPLRPGDPGTP